MGLTRIRSRDEVSICVQTFAGCISQVDGDCAAIRNFTCPRFIPRGTRSSHVPESLRLSVRCLWEIYGRFAGGGGIAYFHSL